MTNDKSVPQGHSLAQWKPVFVDDLQRVGRDRDGGYVVSRRCVDASSLLIALGISDDWSFEETFAQLNPNADIICVDGSVSARIFWNRAIKSALRSGLAAACFQPFSALQHFRSASHWLLRASAFRQFFSRERGSFVQKFVSDYLSEQTTTLGHLLKDTGGDATGAPRLFVKMDIEGGEYRVLRDVLPHCSNVTGMVVEFHDLDLLWERFVELMTELATGLAVVHIHGNNFAPVVPGSRCPRVLEVTFANRALLPHDLRESSSRYPLTHLDRPCDPTKEDYALEF